MKTSVSNNLGQLAFTCALLGWVLVGCGSVSGSGQPVSGSSVVVDDTTAISDQAGIVPGPASTVETDTALRFSDECLAVMVSASEISEYEDTWEDIFPAFEACGSVEELLSAADEANQNGRFDALVESPQVLSNLCDPTNFTEGPHSTELCKSLNR